MTTATARFFEMQAIGHNRLYRFESEKARAVREALIPFVTDLATIEIPAGFKPHPDEAGQFKVQLKTGTGAEADRAVSVAAGDPGRPAEPALLRSRQKIGLTFRSQVKTVGVYAYDLELTGFRDLDQIIVHTAATWKEVKTFVISKLTENEVEFEVSFYKPEEATKFADRLRVLVEETTQGVYTVLDNPRRSR